MKKTKRIITFLTALMVVCLLSTALVACNPAYPDPETRPFSMSISTPDGVFNPFFSTSAYDSSVISLTQISMLSTDPKGNIVCGEDEPTVAKDYYVSESEKLGSDGKPESTTYEFLIKKGIKWSDGTDLTIMDVLFNLYIYLDPAYTGSATVYSTDIVGLQNYRMQVPLDTNISDEYASSFESRFMTEASIRVSDLITYVKAVGRYSATDKPSLSDLSTSFNLNEALADIVSVAKEFYNELTSDWNAINVEDYKDWVGFDEPWKIFLLNDGGYSELLLRNADGTLDKVQEVDKVTGEPVFDANGDPVYTDNYKIDSEVAETYYVQLIQPALDAAIDNGTLISSDPKYDEKRAEIIKDACVNTIFHTYFPFSDTLKAKVLSDVKFEVDDESNKANKDLIETEVASMPGQGFSDILSYWATSGVIFDRFTAEQKSKYFANMDGQKTVPNIPGITTKRVSTFTTEDENGNPRTYDLDGEYDVLSIKINGVDPKAIYNFAFTVSPMSYYSGTWQGKDYVQKAIEDYEAYLADNTHIRTEFGLEFGNSTFMNDVVNATSKIRLPMGAGPYMASTVNGGAATSGTQFFNNNMIYYERNPYFETVGKELENAKIKTVRYKVVASDQLVNSLINKDIDFGDPGAITDNVSAVERAGLENRTVLTNGYGYVGINPRFVPEINVRRAIIKAMNTSVIFDNYYHNLAKPLSYPLSKASWVYDFWEEAAKEGKYEYSDDMEFVSENGTSYAYDNIGDDIEALVIAAGYTKKGGVYSKTIPGFGEDTLDYKFTIAGGSTDHPAYDMFLRAAALLNRHGFNVKVVTSTTALTDLSAGKLEVWAAAWSSAIDPDMYQTYHMESQASSVKNWGYSQIIGKSDSLAWYDEYNIICELSDKIDAGRATTNQSERADIYKEAFDLIMELAVEFPTYQRNDLYAWQANLLDPSTLPSSSELTPFNGVLSRIWEVNYVHA